MKRARQRSLLLIALGLAACGGDSTGTSASPATGGLLASRHAPDDAPRFSAWSAPVTLGAPVNTAAIEQGASISKDGLSLYFHCTGCPDNIGGADIYVSHRPRVGEPWGPPQRLGSNVNTTDNETAPTLSSDGHQLFFARDGQTGLGGTDLYVSRRRDKRDDLGWEPAVNLGPGVNTTLNDARPALSFDGTTMFFQSTRPGAVGCTSPTGPCVFDLWVTTRTRLDDRDDDDRRVRTREKAKKR